jgi:hypothetical protein
MPERPDQPSLAKLKYVPSIYHNIMVPAWIDGALKKATAINPHLRYDDLSEFLFDLSLPNPKFLRPDERLPLMQRNPTGFWKGLSALLVFANLTLLYLLMG